MRRLLAWLGGIVGGITAWRWLRKRVVVHPAEVGPAPAAEVDPRAEALRAKLDEVREADDVLAPETAPEPVSPPEPAAEREHAVEVDPEPEPVADPESRRQSVHEQGRAALDEMRRRPER